MKKILLALIFTSILFLSFISGASITVQENYDKGETLIAKVSGNFIENIQKQNIFFYRRHMPTSIAEYNIIKIQDEFFVYAKIGLEKTPDNYSIQIKGVQYMNGSQISTDNIIGNFSISDSIADFWIYPGAKIIEQDYTLQVQNLQQETITINLNSLQIVSSGSGGGGFFSSFFGGEEGNTTTQSESSIEVLSGEIKDIEFQLENSTLLKEIKLSSENTKYSIPIYNIYEGQNIIIGENETPEEINNNEIIIEEEIILEDPNEEIIINETTGETITRREATLKPCVELNGVECTKEQECEGTSTSASDGMCCIGECKEKTSSNTGKLIGWILIIAVAILLIWFFMKKKNKSGKPVNLLKIGSKK